MIVLILVTIIFQSNALPLQSYNSLPIVPYRGRVMADNRDSVISTQPRYFFYPRVIDTDKVDDAAVKPMEVAAKPVDKVVQQDKDLLLVPSLKKNTIVNGHMDVAAVEDADLTRNVRSLEQINQDGDLLDVAENNIVFRPLFSYRRQSAQRSRLSRNQDYN